MSCDRLRRALRVGGAGGALRTSASVVGGVWSPQRRHAHFSAPPPPPPPTPPNSSGIAFGAAEVAAECFAAALARAAADAAREGVRGGDAGAARQSGRLSPWSEYLVGLRLLPPTTTTTTVAAAAARDGPGDSARAPSTAAWGDGVAESRDVFVRHAFDNVADAALFSTTRRPHTFLRPEAPSSVAASELDAAWRVMPISAALQEMQAVLQDMAVVERRQRRREGEAAALSSDVVAFWRAMLEQAFLQQYCDLAGVDGGTSDPALPRWLRSLYPHDYTTQPAGLRRRLERGIRSLLCASAHTLHMQWEQHMARHAPSDVAAQVLGLEFVMLWWWANPDQMPIELSLATQQLPPPTLQRRRQARTSDGAAEVPRYTDGAAPLATEVSVEAHLWRHLEHHFGTDDADELQQRRRRAAHRAGGLLCPAAMLPPPYRDSVRARLVQMPYVRSLVTCPLFPRVVEVALAVATSDAAAMSAERRPRSVAARRGHDIALQLCHDWLWPVVCGGSAPSAPHEASQQHSPRRPTGEAIEDWAVLVAVVAAVSQVRCHLLALRRSSGATARGRPSPAHAAPSERHVSLAYVREELYIPLVATLLPNNTTADAATDLANRDRSGAPAAIVPDWALLIFARVSACFAEAGMLQPAVAQQPATPARLWHLLFRTMCDTVPHVLHSGSTVTVMWVLLALEGVCTGPSMYYSTYRPTNAARVEALSAWWGTIAGVSSTAAPVGGTAEPAPEADESAVAAAVLLAAAGVLVPRTERCQRAAFAHSGADTGDAGRTPALTSVTASVPPGPQRRRGGGGGGGPAAALPSFASAARPPLPLQRHPPDALAQGHAHWEACGELSEEAVGVAVDVFRQYATLPALVTGHAGAPSSSTTAAAPPVSPPPRSRPSFMVLLRLLQVVALYGDGAQQGSAGGDHSGSLLHSVAEDVLTVCHPVVAVHLRKLRVYAAAASGRRGAAALLRDATLQTALECLSPAVGRQRLLSALLWSGLAADALEAAAPTGAVYGSGSLAWHVLERNRRRFLAVTAPGAAADGAAAAPAEDGDGDVGEDANSLEDATACMEEVLRHLWQLAIAIPDSARVALWLHPHVGGGGVASEVEGSGDHLQPHRAAAEHVDGGGDGDTPCAEPVSSFDTDAGALAPVEHGDDAEVGEAAAAAVWDNSIAEEEDDAYGVPANWSGGGDAEVGDDVAAVELPGEEVPAASRWDSRAAVAVEGVGDGGAAPHTGPAWCGVVTPSDIRGLAQALLAATPAAQHLFYSMLEVLSWAIGPRAMPGETTADLAHLAPLGHAHLAGDLGHRWCARLATNYHVCTAALRSLCALAPPNTAAVHGISLLRPPRMLERILLLLLQSCPDVYLVGLTLLAMVGDSGATGGGVRGPLLPWSVETSLAQLLFHAGVTATSVRRWRAEHHLPDAVAQSSVGEDGAAASATAQHVAVHRVLMQRIWADPCGSGSGGGGASCVATQREVLLSVGGLLLCSLERRDAAAAAAAVAGRRRESPALYRYCAYVNEFLLHRLPATAAPITAVRVVLPSVQLTSPSPSTVPPQQVVALRVAWEHDVGRAERAALRGGAAGRRRRTATASVTAPPVLHENDEVAYAASFL
ncbi:hypothetical protein NESM_000392300 [Novymonas esmeraldas]|uniref:Uncharacterized protein n=1 Tax=Novymonas esmeraldas TaxID=1808958 RepID=A0AAW0ENF5_9TRYP